jgi:hypothetical protein
LPSVGEARISGDRIGLACHDGGRDGLLEGGCIGKLRESRLVWRSVVEMERSRDGDMAEWFKTEEGVGGGGII